MYMFSVDSDLIGELISTMTLEAFNCHKFFVLYCMCMFKNIHLYKGQNLSEPRGVK